MSSTPGKQDNLNGSAPDKSETALLIIDVLNDFNYPGGDRLLERSLRIAPCIRSLKARAREAGVPAVYVNDNFGLWRSSFQDLLDHCLAPGCKSQKFVEQVRPDEKDYFILKPKHSGFYQTPLDLLLKHFGTKRVVVTGISTNSCVLFTGHDAYMRDLELMVPEDCSATFTDEEHAAALEQMRNILKANTAKSAELDFAA